MRYRLLISALLASLVAADAVTSQGDRRSRRRRDDRTVELQHFTYRQVEYPAPSVDGDGVYGLYLPKGYDDEAAAERRYPLAVWLHGLRGSHRRFHHGAAEILDAMRGAAEVPPMIVVAPSSSPHTAYMDGERSGDRQTQITRDLLGHLEKTLRVSTERTKRAIMGVSIGGMGAMRIALQQPQLFGTVAVRSQAIVPPEPPADGTRMAHMVDRLGLREVFGDPIDAAKWRREIPAAILADIEPERLDGLRIYFDAGSDDRYGFGAGAARLSESMDERGFEHTFVLIEDGGHSWGTPSFAADCRRAFGFVAEGFTAPPPADEAEGGDGGDGDSEGGDSEDGDSEDGGDSSDAGGGAGR